MTHQHETHCQDILGYLNAYIDGELNPELCSLLETHMETCSNCQIVYNTLKKTIEICQMDSERITLPTDARRRLFTSLNLEDHVNPKSK
jgi:anti-sigma factor RsiW